MCSLPSTPSGLAGRCKAVSLIVKVVPGSSRTQIAGCYGEMLKVKIASPPEKGKANKELLRFLAAQLKIKPKDIQIESGQTSSIKTLLLQGVTEQDVQALFSE
jgi:uncharacterized protein (TIGR00251 family)